MSLPDIFASQFLKCDANNVTTAITVVFDILHRWCNRSTDSIQLSHVHKNIFASTDRFVPFSNGWIGIQLVRATQNNATGIVCFVIILMSLIVRAAFHEKRNHNHHRQRPERRPGRYGRIEPVGVLANKHDCSHNQKIDISESPKLIANGLRNQRTER